MGKHSGPWTKLPRRQMWRHTSGYVVEKVAVRAWDAFLPSSDHEPDYRTAVWTSPHHPSKSRAMATVEMELRRIRSNVRQALSRPTPAAEARK